MFCCFIIILSTTRIEPPSWCNALLVIVSPDAKSRILKSNSLCWHFSVIETQRLLHWHCVIYCVPNARQLFFTYLDWLIRLIQCCVQTGIKCSPAFCCHGLEVWVWWGFVCSYPPIENRMWSNFVPNVWNTVPHVLCLWRCDHSLSSVWHQK